MTPEEYLRARVDDQIDWYSKKSKSNQNWFKGLKLVELASAAVIPFVAGMSSIIPCSAWILGMLGVMVAICAGVTSVYHHQENWINYRATSEALKHEKFLFQTQSGAYADDSSFESFVQRIEALISRENSTWASGNKKQVKNRHNPAVHTDAAR
jgi:hypothetical protein